MQVFLHSNKRIVFFGIIYGNIFFYLYFMKLQLLKKKDEYFHFECLKKKMQKKTTTYKHTYYNSLQKLDASI